MKHIKTFRILLLITTSTLLFMACDNGSSENTNVVEIAENTLGNREREPITDQNKSELPNYDELRLFKADKQLVIWAIQKIGTQAKIHILQPATGKVLKKLVISRALVPRTQIANLVYAYDHRKVVIEARNMLTGGVTLNNVALEKKFANQLAGGVGQANISRSDGWVRLSTKRGKDYFYNPVSDTLVDKRTLFRKKRPSQTGNAGWVPQWVRSYNPDNPKETRFILTQIYQENKRRKPNQGRTINERKLRGLVAQGKTRLLSKPEACKFLVNTFSIHFSKHHVLFTYKTELGPQAKKMLACQNSKGEIVWEKELKSEKMLAFLVSRLDKVTLMDDPAQKNTLAMAKGNKAVGLNLNTGKIAWTYGR
ncbi:hypothetical protein BKI52_42770 [marine bacterium AO1-C]|nr:hypothetical protein BKI52_42770 [marine bacterium AO1-C]